MNEILDPALLKDPVGSANQRQLRFLPATSQGLNAHLLQDGQGALRKIGNAHRQETLARFPCGEN